MLLMVVEYGGALVRLILPRFGPFIQIDGAFLTTRRLRNPLIPRIVTASESLTVDGLLHVAPPAGVRLADAAEAQLTDGEDGPDEDEEAVAPLTPLADIPSDHLGRRVDVILDLSHSFLCSTGLIADGDLETAQSDPETAEEDMACAGPSRPTPDAARRSRSRRRRSSQSQRNLTNPQAEST